jgi:hypothetical protein
MHVVTTLTRARGIHRNRRRRDHVPMDLSELSSPTSPARSTPGHPAAADCASGDAAWQLACQIAAEVATPLTHALERALELQATGRIDRPGLHALVTQIEQARRASMVGQQIARLAQGGTQQQHETLNLTQALRDVLAQRQRELDARGVAVKQVLKPADVVVDATLLSLLIHTLLDWALRHACSSVDIELDMKSWPRHARLACRFEHMPPDQVVCLTGAGTSAPASQHAPALDSLSWQLLAQVAHTMQLPIGRHSSGGATVLTIEFPHTANDSLEGASSFDISNGFALANESRPLAGSHVLVMALRRDVRNQIRQAVAHMGLTLDFVTTTDGAREFCQQGLPNAIVYESAIYDSVFDRLRNDIRHQCPDLAWVEITEQGEAFEISSFGGVSMARVGRDAIGGSLPSALMFELAKGL